MLKSVRIAIEEAAKKKRKKDRAEAQKSNLAVLKEREREGEQKKIQEEARKNIQQVSQERVNVQPYVQSLTAGPSQQELQQIEMLRQMARGQGQTAAQAQLRSAIDESIAAQMAAGASVGNPAAARAASQQAAMIQQAGAGQSAQLRAQEQQAAMNLYTQALANQRAQMMEAQRAAAGLELGAVGQTAEQRQAALNAYLGAAAEASRLGLGYGQLQQQERLTMAEIAAANQRAKMQIEAQREAARKEFQGQVLGAAIGGIGSLGASLIK